ncbi:hypothetical protein D5086_021905 [Populus alba]|uniref:Uncharacterized protein n=1 Tax=Populus alba TaxID=43335 RepID=A0ACC4BEY1_POPAL
MKLKHGNTRIMYVNMWIVVSVCNKWKQKLHSHEALESFGSRSIGHRILLHGEQKLKAVWFGPACKAAYDADKVFLAAFDKLEAMMPKGNFYAPDGDNHESQGLGLALGLIVFVAALPDFSVEMHLGYTRLESWSLMLGHGRCIW